MTSKLKPQSHMDDTVIEDAELEKMLEERQELKASVTAYNKVDKSAKEKIRAIETPGPFRVGRFLITRSPVEGREVAFATQPGFRFTIKLAGETEG